MQQMPGHLPIRCTTPGALPSSPRPRQDHRTRPNTPSQTDQIQHAAHHSPPTSPFMQRSAASTPVDHTTYNPPPSSEPQHAPDARQRIRLGFLQHLHQRSSRLRLRNPRSMAADYLNEIRVQRFIDEPPTTPSPSHQKPHTNPALRHHTRMGYPT